MPQDKKFKQRVRARMEKTGESYSAARAQLDEAPQVTKRDGVTYVNIPGLSKEASDRITASFRLSLVPPPETIAPITQACAKLATQIPGAAVLCWSNANQPIAEVAADDALREQLREFLSPIENPMWIRAIDYMGYFFHTDRLLAVRRLSRERVRAPIMGALLLVVFSRASLSLELARMHVDHAALAIESILAKVSAR